MPPKPDFTSKDFLENHIQKTLDFYAPRVLDETGGFIQHFKLVAGKQHYYGELYLGFSAMQPTN